MSKQIHYRLKRRKKDFNGAVLLTEYAKQKYLSPETIRYRIATKKIAGFMFRGRWFVNPHVWP